MAVFALLQFNDPDPLVWVVAYALVTLAIAAPPEPDWSRLCTWLAGGMLLSLALIALRGFIDFLQSGDVASIAAEMSPDRPHVEPAREFLGVVIAAVALIVARQLGMRETEAG